jgi:hypothetical protein
MWPLLCNGHLANRAGPLAHGTPAADARALAHHKGGRICAAGDPPAR